MTLATALLMAGCSQNEITEISPDANPAMGFSVYSEVQTRGTEIKVDGLKAGFGVFAYYTRATAWASASEPTPNFMCNQKVESNDGTNWTYNPVKYWPMADEKVTFFAYAPYSGISGSGVTAPQNTDKGAPKLTFAIETTGDATKMVDFVVAKNVASTESNPTQDRTYTTSGSDGVKFTFAHVLSRLTFEGKPSVDLAANTATKGTTYVMVKSAKIPKPGTAGSAGSAKFYKSGSFDCGTATWNSQTVATDDYDITKVLAIASHSDDVTGYNTEAVALTNADAVTLFTDKEYLFLIPETASTGTGTDTAGDITIQFAYDIVTKDSNVNGGYTITSHTTDAKLPTGALIQGTAYKYTVSFGINEVKIATPEVEAWGNETPGSITA